MKSLFLWSLLLVLASCAGAPGKLRTKGGTEVTPPRNAQAASTVYESASSESMPIAQGSRIIVTDTLGKKVTELTLAEDTVRRTQGTATAASLSPPRAPDTSVELRKTDNAERRPLLFLAIGLGLASAGLAYFRLLPLAKLAGLGAGVCLGFWWALGNEVFLKWIFLVLASVAAAYLIYSDWRKKRLQGTILKTEQSLKEFAVDHPVVAKSLQEEYLDVNLDDAHKVEAAKALAKIDRSYIEQKTKEKLAGGV